MTMAPRAAANARRFFGRAGSIAAAIAGAASCGGVSAVAGSSTSGDGTAAREGGGAARGIDRLAGRQGQRLWRIARQALKGHEEFIVLLGTRLQRGDLALLVGGELRQLVLDARYRRLARLHGLGGGDARIAQSCQFGGKGFRLLGIARLCLAALIERFFDGLQLLVRALVLCHRRPGEQGGDKTKAETQRSARPCRASGKSATVRRGHAVLLAPRRRGATSYVPS